MIYLYTLPIEAMIAMVMTLTLLLCTAMFCMVNDLFSLRFARRNLGGTLLDAGNLAYLGILLACTARVCYQSNDRFITDFTCDAPRTVLWVILLGTGIQQAMRDRSLRPMIPAAASALTLPLLDSPSFPVLLAASLICWLLYGADRLQILKADRKQRLSAYSVKEAVDTMDFGILFCRAGGRAEGQILLTNRKMQDLMFTLTGDLSYNGKSFYEALAAGQVLPACIREPADDRIVYTLPDGSAWMFEQTQFDADHMECTVLTASDVTRQKRMTDSLYGLERELAGQNEELNSMLQNMNEICLSEQRLQAKNRIHDILGQQISLFLSCIREHRQPDKTLLQFFAHDLVERLKDPDGAVPSLEAIAKSYRSIGVEILTEGELPEPPELSRLWTEIASEAITNAVRHGYASRIWIESKQADGCWNLCIRDNGSGKEEAITEGGGLTEMRQRVSEAGGTFSYQITPDFQIWVRIPGGGK